MDMWREKLQNRIRQYYQTHGNLWIATQIGGGVLICLLQYVQMDFTCSYLTYLLHRGLWLTCANFVIVLTFNCVLYLIMASGHRALACSSILFFVFSVANHYAWLYHGTPFSIRDFTSIGTAIQVMGSYTYALDKRVVVSILIFLLNISVALFLKISAPHKNRKRTKKTMFFASAASAVSIFFAAFFVVNVPHWGGNFSECVNMYGYVVSAVREVVLYYQPLAEPEGYNEDALRVLAANSPALQIPEKKPDIILILNETFYDLEQYTELSTDADYMANWYERQNAITGYSVVPGTGGGTNGSEYELLTSNDLCMLKDSAPFSVLDLSDANSIVRYCKEMGYETWGAHPFKKTNYSRYVAYPALGFDHVAFETDFTGLQSYGNRPCTDASVYQNLINRYEAGGEDPRFMYLLTYQNHGGYDSNESTWDTVHTATSVGEYAEEINEYLTSVQMSNAAFTELLAYFEKVDRPVIVCMVGDHAPVFVNSLPAKGTLKGTEEIVTARGTPFVIWGNSAFGHIEQKNVGYLTLTDLVPTLLKTAGLPLTPYYQEILELSEKIPVRLREGQYLTADGKEGNLGDGTEENKQLMQYFWCEYNNLQPAEKRVSGLFSTPKAE